MSIVCLWNRPLVKIIHRKFFLSVLMNIDSVWFAKTPENLSRAIHVLTPRSMWQYIELIPRSQIKYSGHIHWNFANINDIKIMLFTFPHNDIAKIILNILKKLLSTLKLKLNILKTSRFRKFICSKLYCIGLSL